MAHNKIYEGTLAEITALYGFELQHRHLKVTVDDDASDVKPPFFAGDPKEWSRALAEWASGHSSHSPYLPDEAVSRESIYEGRG